MSNVTAWLALAGVGTMALTVDLALAFRRSRPSLRSSTVAALAWTVVGLAFTGVASVLFDADAAGDYLTVFVLEKSLSLDNVAVFAVVMSAFAVPVVRQPRVLLVGVLAAVVLRIVFVVAGLAAVNAIHGLLIAFGVVLIVAGVRILRTGEPDPEHVPPIVDWLRRRRVSATAAAVAALAATDVVFAVDSVPAAFAVTRDTFPIIAANVFAVLGLRPLYDVLAAAMRRLSHLERALGALIALIGVALCVQPLWTVPEWVILTGVVATLGAGVLFSLVPPRLRAGRSSR
jgi:tellurite resistance protein TerC